MQNEIDDVEQMARLSAGDTAALRELYETHGRALLRFSAAMCRSRQAEAQANLAALATQQATYKVEKNKYASSITELGFKPATDKYYDVTIDSASATAFTATATGKGDAAGDVWTVDQTAKASVKTDKCH